VSRDDFEAKARAHLESASELDQYDLSNPLWKIGVMLAENECEYPDFEWYFVATEAQAENLLNAMESEGFTSLSLDEVQSVYTLKGVKKKIAGDLARGIKQRKQINLATAPRNSKK